MAWENFDKLFPDGVIPQHIGITAQDLRDHQIDVVIAHIQEMDGHMVRNIKQYIYGQDGSYAINTQYDIQGALRHVEQLCALNDYGAKMLTNYIKEHNLEEEIKNLEPIQTVMGDQFIQIQERDGVRYIE